MTRLAWMIGALFLASSAAASDQSRYGCTGLEEHTNVPTLEGRDGVFYRIGSDLRTYFGMSEPGYDYVAALSDALADRGTTLVYVPTLTKSLAMPDFLPERAALYGFDLALADTVLDTFIDSLRRRGVVTVDLRPALRARDGGDFVYYQSDFHWTPTGAHRAATAVSNAIRDLPVYAELDPLPHVTEIVGETELHSALRSELQPLCRETLPPTVSATYRTEVTEAPGSGGELDLFGPALARPDIALIGTSFSANETFHFPGFLAQETGLDVVNHAITGGSTFGAAQSYLLSAEFDEAPPRILVWENPIYSNPMRSGEGPMRELVAAVRGGCSRVLQSFLSADRRTLALEAPAFGPDDVLYLDADQRLAARATFRFRSEDGRERLRPVARADRTKRTGRFFISGAGLGTSPQERIEVDLDRPFGTAAVISLCPPIPDLSKENPS